jgi:hypothetical protein
MSVEGSVDVAVEILGGLVTNIVPADLPHGVSPDCQDVRFEIGSVRTRPGVTAQYTLAGNPTINYLKTYETLNEVPRLLSLDSLGILRKDVAPGGALTTISSAILPGSFIKSTSLFGREYLAMNNGTNGVDIPRQYDDTNFDRISQCGPGAAPAVVDEAIVLTIVASANGTSEPVAANIANSPNGAVQTGNIVTITVTSVLGVLGVGAHVVIAGVGVAGYNGTQIVTAILNNAQFQYILATSGLAASGGGTAQSCIAQYTTVQNYLPNGLVVGQSVTIAGVGVAGYNGTFNVFAQGGQTVFFVDLGVANLAASGGGTVTLNGNIPAGKHQLSVIFVTRNKYYTKPAPPITWTAGGGKRAIIGNIPIGPPNVIARVLCFTAVNGASFYHLGPTGLTLATSNMYIADNSTTTLTVDFTDQLLLLGTLDDPLFNQIELPPVAGIIDYSTRLFAWGEQGNLQNLLNLSFDGGFTTGMLPLIPLGWTPDATLYPGGASAINQGQPVVFGDAFAIFGNGATAVRGKITQTLATDYLGNPILLPNTAYSVRARIQVNAAAGAGTMHIGLTSASQGILITGISLAWNQLTQTYLAYSAPITAGLAAIPSDLLLNVYVDGTPNNTAIFLIDDIQIFPTNAQFNNSNVRGSKGQLNTQGQESYDSQTGLIQVSLNDGQSVRTAFKIRERLYFVKEHGFYVTQDDGVNECSSWQVLDVSKKVGTPSINGVGIGEDWVVIAHRTGLYLFWGGEPQKISQEIQPTWDTINWQYGSTISVTVDTRKKRMLVCAPFGASTIPNKTLVLDYHDVGDDPTAIAGSPPIHLTYTGRKTAFDRARKWCPWTIPANSIAQIEQANLQTLVYFGSNDGTGRINQLDDTGTVFTDNGAVIPSYYTTAFFVEQSMEQALRLNTHRKLFQYLTMYTQGSGTVGVTVYLDSLLNAIVLNPQTLSNPAMKDIEMTTNQLIERMAVKLSSSGVGQWFDFQKMTVNAKPDPWAAVRGIN